VKRSFHDSNAAFDYPEAVADIEMVRIGILGAARIVPAALIEPARAVPEARVVAIAARDFARARAFASRHGIPRAHETYQAVLDDSEIDAIYNPLPNSLHCEWAIRALKAGKHVLCEKPLANNAGEAQRMAAAAEDAGRMLVEAFHYRYHPLALRMKEIVDSGELGEVRHLEAHFCVPLIRLRDIRYRYELGGGATMDLGCYCINLIRYLAGAEPEVTHARARLAAPQIDRFMEADFRFPNGGTGRIVCSMLSLALLRAQATVRGTKAELRVRGPFQPHRFHRLAVRSGNSVRVEHCSRESTYAYQLRAFVAAVRGKPELCIGLADAIANMRVIDAVYQKAGLKPRGY
jgi:predicted dehydrogenase